MITKEEIERIEIDREDWARELFKIKQQKRKDGVLH